MVYSHHFCEPELELISVKSIDVFDALNTQGGVFTECDLNAVGAVLSIMIKAYCDEYPDQKPVIEAWLMKEFSSVGSKEVH